MSHVVVKILTSDDGDKVNSPVWCYVSWSDTQRTFCSGEAFGMGESGCTYKVKTVIRGGITCQSCLNRIKEVKSVKL